MKRLLLSMFVLIITLNAANAQENPMKSLWPFGKPKTELPSFDSMNPFSGAAPARPTNNKSTFGLPSPTKWINQAQQKTDAAFQKTRLGIQNVSKSLNPFSAAKPKKKKKASWLDTILPRKPVETSPATMDEFMQLKRPRF